MIELWQGIERSLAADRPVFLALVAAASRHSPGSPGARLVATPERDGAGGEVWGTVGGGVLELRLVERARRILREGSPFFEVLTYRHRPTEPGPTGDFPGIGEPSGLICGGWQTHVHRLLSPGPDLEAVRRVIRGLADEAAGAVLFLGLPGLRVEDGAFDPTRPPIELERSRPADGVPSWTVREQLVSTRRAAVVGAGHCGRSLAACLARLGYRVILFDDRPEVAAAAAAWASDLTGAEGRVEVRPVGDYRRAGAGVPWPEITPAVVMTTAFPSDVRALEGLLPRPFPFVGLMGSPAKIEAIEARLAEQVPAGALERLVAPVGLGVDSHTPEEIAVSVAAQILGRRGAWSAGRLEDPRRPREPSESPPRKAVAR